MAGWPAPKTQSAVTQAMEMSVAVGMPQPLASVAKSSASRPGTAFAAARMAR